MSEANDALLIRTSLDYVEPVADTFSRFFYAHLFVECPELREMFPVVMADQRERLWQALLRVAHGTGDHEALRRYLRRLGRDHRKFGIRPAHYAAVRRSLLAALRRYCWLEWTPAVERAWERTLDFVAALLDSALQSDLDTPDWWFADVVAHERRTSDIAVVTAQLREPLPYLPGQHVSVETQRWPRVWRTYSMANPPRPDRTLEFHVRAMRDGWVSRSIVYRSRVGDVWRIGHPVGTMVADPDSDRDVVCVAGGCGLAPVRAIVADLVRRRGDRAVHVFFGARRTEELYDLPALLRLETEHPWLTVVPAVSEDPGYYGEFGQICDVVARHGSWSEHDVFVSGWSAMVRATLDRLRGLGVPDARIRHSCYGPA